MATLSDVINENKYQEIFKKILRKSVSKGIANHSPTYEDNPTVIIFGGQPGAGKSHSIESCELFEQPHYRIDTDMLREDVPGFTAGQTGEF